MCDHSFSLEFDPQNMHKIKQYWLKLLLCTMAAKFTDVNIEWTKAAKSDHEERQEGTKKN